MIDIVKNNPGVLLNEPFEQFEDNQKIDFSQTKIKEELEKDNYLNKEDKYNQQKVFLDDLYYNINGKFRIGNQQCDYDLCFMDKEKEITTKWRKYSEICFDCEDSKNKWFIEKSNNRTIFPNEIVLDLEEPERYKQVLDGLEEEGLSFRAFKTGSKGFHFHLFFSKELTEEEKLLLIKKYDCDTQKAGTRCMIALEYAPHWKTGNHKELLTEKQGINNYNSYLKIFKLDGDASNNELSDELVTNNSNSSEASSYIPNYDELSSEVLQLIATRQEESATELIVEWIEEYYNIYSTRDDLKTEIWFYENGIYKPNGMSRIKELSRKILLKTYTPQRVNKIIAKIEADTQIEQDEFFDVKYIDKIPVLNGILDLRERKILPFTPKMIFFNKLPVEYNPESTCPNIDKFFSDILKESEDKEVMYEKIGYCLWGEHFIEKATLFNGGGRNGKGKTLSLIKTFLGAENTCSVSLQQMNSNSTGICELHGKLANLAGDLDKTALKETGMFKEITGRDQLCAKRKYFRDLFFVNTSKQFFACNELPRVYDMSEGFWDRWDLFEFPYRFVSQDEYNSSTEDKSRLKIINTNIIEKLTTKDELSGLLNEALNGLQRILKQKNFSNSKGTKDVKDFWIRKADSFMAFCMDCVEEDEDGTVSKKEMRSQYHKYCKKFRLRGTGDKSIKVTLEDQYGVMEGFKSIVEFGAQEYIWEGIKLNLNKMNKISEKVCKIDKKEDNMQDMHLPEESHRNKNTIGCPEKVHKIHIENNQSKTPKYEALKEIPSFVLLDGKEHPQVHIGEELELEESIANILLSDNLIKLVTLNSENTSIK